MPIAVAIFYTAQTIECSKVVPQFHQRAKGLITSYFNVILKGELKNNV
jgi:hypothetical protein